jgi:hypothetical protein
VAGGDTRTMKPIWRCGLLAYMEAIVRPQAWDHRDKMGMRPFSQALRFEKGEAMVLQDKPFLERSCRFAEPGEGDGRR